MKFAVKKLPAAEQDAVEAAAWYDEQQPGLGDRFLDELEEVVSSLALDALRHRIRFHSIRRANLPSFPYGIFYSIQEDCVQVIAILHGARHSRVARRRKPRP